MFAGRIVNHVLAMLCLIFLGGISCKAQENLKNLANQYIKAKLNDSAAYGLYSKLYDAGKEAVPFLINEIDRNEKTIFGKREDLRSSFLSPKRQDYVGLWAMHLIEHIQNGSISGDPDRIVEVIIYKTPQFGVC
jgi:hypothetical protein